MDLIWEKKMVLNNHNRAKMVTATSSYTPGANQPTLLGKHQDGLGIKRELNLLNNRLNKLFPVGK
jgi:hypothetical protein